MKYRVKEVDAESSRCSSDAKLDKCPLEEKLERTVTCSSILIVGLGSCLLALSVYTTVLVLDAQGVATCVSEQCVQTASRMLSALNKDVEPCEDFYEFACGGWIKQHPVPEWASSWDQLAILREQLIKDLRELLEDQNDTSSQPSSVVKAKALYRTCIDEDKMEELGTKPIEDLMRVLGLSSQPPESANASLQWERVVGQARRLLGLSVLVSVQVAEDVRNTSRNRVVLEQVPPGFSERYLLEPERFALELEQYRKYIIAMISSVSPHTDDEQFAEDIIIFSTHLAKIMTPVEVRRSGTHLFHEVSVAQFYQGASGGPVQWKEHNWQIFVETTFSNTNVTLDVNKDRMIVMDLPYLQKLSQLIADTPKLVVERFLWWSVFSTVAPMTLKSFRDMGFEFSSKVYGLQQRTPRWKSCASNTNTNFGIALSYLYVQRHFDLESREKAIAMLSDVREAFSAAVQELDWMDNSTRIKTLDKLKAIRNFVGFPRWLLTQKQLDDNYKHAEVVEGKLFETYLKLTQAAVKKSLEMLREKPDRNRWVATATTVNAFYSATLNSVTFPAGILQPPFYGNGIEAINYGSIGAIMGHEVTHGFDDQGRRYDEDGNLKQWWSAATLEHYHGKVQCIIDQYNQYHVTQLPNYTVHGFNTQGENIADNGGLRAALNAYRLYSSRQPQARRDRLPGLPQYQPDQLFFLGFAQIWCGNSTVGALKSKLVEGVHSPNKIRVVGTLSNSREFAEAWKCPKGSPMNPEHKCVLW